MVRSLFNLLNIQNISLLSVLLQFGGRFDKTSVEERLGGTELSAKAKEFKTLFEGFQAMRPAGLQGSEMACQLAAGRRIESEILQAYLFLLYVYRKYVYFLKQSLLLQSS